MTSFSREETENRLLKLQRMMAGAGLDGCLVTQNVGIYYLAGSMQTGFLFVPAEGQPTYYVRRSLARAQAESHVRIAELGSMRQFGARLTADYPATFAEGRIPAVGADLDVMPAQLYLRLSEAAPSVRWQDASVLLRKLRILKSPYEIGCIRKAARVTADALDEGLKQMRAGMAEIELMAVIEGAMRRAGHAGVMRMRGYNSELVTGMVAAGEAAAEPTYFDGPAGGRGLTPAAPQSASLRPIGRDEPVLIDIGCCIDGYVIDQTRTAVIGTLSPSLRAAYETSVAILRRTEEALKPGALPEALYEESVRMAAEAGLAGHFMGFGRDQVKFLGHGVGLEIDEWPVLARGFADPLEPGMILAVEPKFTFPGVGVVGIENTYLITDTGFETLTLAPEKLFELPG